MLSHYSEVAAELILAVASHSTSILLSINGSLCMIEKDPAPVRITMEVLTLAGLEPTSVGSGAKCGLALRRGEIDEQCQRSKFTREFNGILQHV